MSTVLIIDDSKSHRDSLRKALEETGDFDRILEAADGMRGMTMLFSEDVDAVLCDLEMPGFNGEKVLLAKNARADLADVPFLVATGSNDIHRRVKLLEDGAQDVIMKPFHPAELVARLRGHLEIRHLRRELSERNRRLEELSTTDALTLLRNRRFVDETLEKEIIRARRHKTALSILMMDLDHFKRVNDDYGHPAGDEVLREAARRIMLVLRASDTAARYGGEEFLILLANEDEVGASSAAERWRAIIADSPIELPDGTKIAVTASIGAATFTPAIESAVDFVSRADAALYRAKRAGRNRVVSAESDDPE